VNTIGIIGGAGPMASCRLYQLIIEQCQQNYGCFADADFPRIIIDSYPFADMLSDTARKKNKQILVQQLQGCFDQLVKQGANVIAIACNTLHTLIADIILPPQVEFIHITDTTKAYSKKCNLSRLLILATATTITQKLYQSDGNNDSKCIVPNEHDQVVIDTIITDILSGNISQKNSLLLNAVVERYNADGVILGCTELPLLNDRYPITTSPKIKVLDTLSILATTIVDKNFYGKKNEIT
jgi:aspartate racemase